MIAKTPQQTIGQLKKELALAKRRLARVNTKAGRMDEALRYPALPQELYDLLEKEGFMTGSKVYAKGIVAADEDWCIALHPKVFEGYVSGVDDAGYFEDDGFASLYAHDGMGGMINILCFSNYPLFESWRKTTRLMHDMAAANATGMRQVLEKKWCRTRLFQALRDINWPVKALSKDLDQYEAIKLRKCKRCGRRADHFSSKPERDHYMSTAICERCYEEKVQEPVQIF